MHPYTVVLVVLGSIGLFVVLALVVFAFFTDTFCFAKGEPRGGRSAGGGRKKGQVKKGGKEEPKIKVDTSYVVGQDYHPELEHERDLHQQAEVQHSSGRGSMVIQEGPPSSKARASSPLPRR